MLPCNLIPSSARAEIHGRQGWHDENNGIAEVVLSDSGQSGMSQSLLPEPLLYPP